MSSSLNTIRLHRVLRAPTDRVYNAFLDAHALCRWLPPYGFLGQIERIDPTVGGGYRMSFTNFNTRQSHWFESTFLELVPHQRIRIRDKFDDPWLAGEIYKVITLRSVGCGTELEILHEGLPSSLPMDMCYLGWQESLLQLANLVEHEIPPEK